MKTVCDIIAHYQSKPWDMLGLPFFLIAVGMTVWLAYDAYRTRRRQTFAAEQRRIQHIIETSLRDGRQKEMLAAALNEAREKLGLPPIDVFDLTTV